MTLNRKAELCEQIAELEAEGQRLAAMPWPSESGRTPHTDAVARLNVELTTARRERASIIRREAGLTA